MSQLPEDPTRAAMLVARTAAAAREMMRQADREKVNAMLPRLRELLNEVDGATAMMLLVHHLASWAVAVAAEAAEEGNEDRRDVALNLPAVLLGHVVAGSWELLRQQAAAAAAEMIGEPVGHA